MRNFVSPIQLACSDDELRPALNHVFFQDGKAVATNAHLLVCQDLKISGFEQEEIDRLNGKFLHKKKFAKIIKEEFIVVNESGIQAQGGIFFEFDNPGEQFPDWKKILEKNVSATHEIGINPKMIEKAAKALKVKGDQNAGFKFRFNGANKGIIAVPVEYEEAQTFALIMPIMLNQ